MRAVSALAFFVSTLTLGCTPVPARPHLALSAGAEPLRTEFNQNAGRVRILMIAAPT